MNMNEVVAWHLLKALRAVGKMAKGEWQRPVGVTATDLEEATVDLTLAWERLGLRRYKRNWILEYANEGERRNAVASDS